MKSYNEVRNGFGSRKEGGRGRGICIDQLRREQLSNYTFMNNIMRHRPWWATNV